MTRVERYFAMSRQQNNQQVQAMTNKSPNKREEILLVANRLFRQKGYNGTSMQDIAKGVDLLKGSLYHHFPGKDEILNELLDGAIDRLLRVSRSILERTDLGPRDKVREIIKQHVLHLTMSYSSLSIANNELDKLTESHREVYLAKRQEYNKNWSVILEAGIQKGEFPPLDVELTSKGIRGMINWLLQWYRSDGPFQPDYIANYFAFLICDMMLAQTTHANKSPGESGIASEVFVK